MVPSTLKRLVREPLVHFALLGVLIFALARGWSGSSDGDARRGLGDIVVTPARVESLVLGFTRTWRRPPDDAELRDLVREYVRDEAATREAMALGLDRDDLVIRRRLRQKLEFVTEDVEAREPTDAQLADYLAEHRADYADASRIAFRQVFLDPRQRGGRIADDARRLLVQLRSDDARLDIEAVGDSRMLPLRIEAGTTAEVSAQFGERFVTALRTVSTGRWEGPVASAMGLHLVYVEAWNSDGTPQLARVRDAVRRDWDQAKRRLAREKYYETLLARYRITIDDGTAGTPSSATGKP